MRTTGLFTTHSFEIPFDKYNEPVYLIPFGDVHKSSPLHSAGHWDSFRAWAKDKKRAYFLGMGDYNDLASTSERNILENPNLHESTVKTLEQLYIKQTDMFYKDIEFMKGRIIGIMNGNHYGVLQSGITTDQWLAQKLGCKFLGVNCFIRLKFKYTSGSARHSLDIFAHHGVGGGRIAGGLGSVERLSENAQADIYLMGDNHQKAQEHKTKLVLNEGGGIMKVVQRKTLFARTGSFLKSYVEGEQSYIVDRAMSPSDLGVVKIELTPRRDGSGGENKKRFEDRWIDIHASI